MKNNRKTNYFDIALEPQPVFFDVLRGLIPRQHEKINPEALQKSVREKELGKNQSESRDLEAVLMKLKKQSFLKSATLFSRGKRRKFVLASNDSFNLNIRGRGIDGLSARIISQYRACRPETDDMLLEKFFENYEKLKNNLTDRSRSFIDRLSPRRTWNFSMAIAMLIGMLAMTFIYQFLGQGASARNSYHKQDIALSDNITADALPKVLGQSQKNDNAVNQESVDFMEKILAKMADNKNLEQGQFESEIQDMVAGYPIEKMIPDIIKKDKIVAAFLISIAKKESDWGKHVPLYQGNDCFNYWGYKGPNRVGTNGHSCFLSREEAVDTVATRLDWLIKNKKLDTPAKLVIWKCGNKCSSDDQAAVSKWIADVNMYFLKLNKKS